MLWPSHSWISRIVTLLDVYKRQIEDFYRQFRREGTLVLVDPVMGDHGKPYRTYTPELCGRMRDVAAQADVITPNLTEAALLLEEDYAALPQDEEGLRAWLERLSLDGRRSVVLTGVSLRPGAIGAGCFDRATGRIRFAMARQEPAQFPGTGDLFASVVLGAVSYTHLDVYKRQGVDHVGDAVHDHGHGADSALDLGSIDHVDRGNALNFHIVAGMDAHLLGFDLLRVVHFDLHLAVHGAPALHGNARHMACLLYTSSTM